MVGVVGGEVVTLGAEPQRRCVLQSPGEGVRRVQSSRWGVPGSLATWDGEELRCSESYARTGGGRPRGWGSAQGPRVQPLESLCCLLSSRNHVGRKRRGRAQQFWRAATPSLWGSGVDWPAARTPAHAGSPSLHPFPGPHPWWSQEGTCERVCAKNPKYPEFQVVGR